MSSVTAFNRLPQLGMIPVSGHNRRGETPPLFGMNAEIIKTASGFRVNHSGAVSIVGVHNRRAKRSSANFNRRLKITAECQSVLSAGSQKHSALSICVMATRTNALFHRHFRQSQVITDDP